MEWETLIGRRIFVALKSIGTNGKNMISMGTVQDVDKNFLIIRDKFDNTMLVAISEIAVLEIKD